MEAFHLVQVCTRFRSGGFNDLLITKEELTSSCNFSRTSTVSPARGENNVYKTSSPDRVNTCGFGVHTRNLSASNEAILETSHDPLTFPECCERKIAHQYVKEEVLRSSRARSSGLSVATTCLGSNQDEVSVGNPTSGTPTARAVKNSTQSCDTVKL